MSSIDKRLAKKTEPLIPVSRRRVVVDFEARSQLSVLDVGGWIYSRHPSTSILCLCWSYVGEDTVFRWNPAFPEAGIDEHGAADLKKLFKRIAEGYEVEAHNAFFELSVWTNVGHARLGWPLVPMNQWRCSASKAASFNLPRALDTLGEVLELKQQKDMDGHKAMLKCSKWRKPTKKLPGRWHDGPDARDDLLKTFDYCAQDIRAEKAVSEYLRELSPHELSVWQMDQRMNLRGVHCDVEGAKAAIAVASAVQEKYLEELRELTGDPAMTPTRRDALKKWCSENGTYLENTQGDYIDSMLETYTSLTPTVRRVLEICRACGRSSISKYSKMLETADDDGRMRDLMMYHGASTGRWTGRYVQPHNFVRGSVKDMDGLWEDILAVAQGKLSPLWLRFAWGDEMEILSHATRGAITATPGKRLWVADYAAIEARVLFWLFHEEEAVKVLASGEDIYCAMATVIYGRTITKKDAAERQLGKKAILGLGYQMGAPRFMDECLADGITITRELAEKVVKAYRDMYCNVSRGWYLQEDAAIRAVRLQGKGQGLEVYVDQTGRTRQRPFSKAGVVKCGRVEWGMMGRFLHVRLPSGRLLSYYRPQIEMAPTPWGDMRPKLTYLGQDQKTKAWVRIDTYGGKLVENMVQAIARDLMADAMLLIDEHPVYDVLLSVHDEIICEADEGKGNLHEYETLMATTRPWADGCPVKAEGWEGFRYRK